MIDLCNSTTDTLSGSATYTGTFYDVQYFNSISIIATTDVAGTLYAEFSTDASTISRSIQLSDGLTPILLIHSLIVIAKYFRVKVVNGSSGQSSMDVQTIYSEQSRIAQPTSRLQQPVLLFGDVINTRSVNVGEQPDGTFKHDPANGQAYTKRGVIATNEIFNSDWIDTHGYNIIECFIKSDQISDTNGIVFEFTDDLSGTPTAQFSDLYTFSAVEVAAGFVNFNIQPKMVGFRLTYNNAGTATSSAFLLQMDLKTNGNATSRLDAVLSGKEDVTNVRSITVGQEPDGTFQNNLKSGVAFVTSATLTSSSTFTSACISLIGYQQIQTAIESDQDGTVNIIFYTDSSCSNAVRTISIPYMSVNNFELFSAPAFTDYVVYSYTNGSVNQTVFHYETKLLISALSGQVLSTTAPINSRMVANLGRNITIGQQPDGTFVNDPHNGVAFTTSATLNSGVEYISSTLSGWTDTDGYNSIELFVTSDVVSASNGLKFEFIDNLTTTIVQETLSYTFGVVDVARGFLNLVIPPLMVGFRIRYCNGGTNQSTFLLQVDLKINGSNNLYNEGGALIVATSNTEIALGNIPNHQIFHNFAVVLNVDSADSEKTIWPLANDDGTNVVDRKTYNTSAQLIYISSTSGSDTSKDINMTLIDSNGIEQIVTTTLNGQTPVSTGITGLDCNGAYLSSSDDTLVGDVYIFLSGDATSGIPDDDTEILAFVPLIYGKSQQATFRVPAGERMVITNIYISIIRASGSATSATIYFRVKEVGKSWNVIKPLLITSQNVINKSENILLNSGDFIEFTLADVSDTDTSCNIEFEYQLIRNL